MYFRSTLRVQVNWIVTEKQVKDKQNKCQVAFLFVYLLIISISV